jgi:NTE family protein
VFEGGGVTGISYVGALKALEEKKFNIHRCAGTSAGSIIAALVVAGYTSKELIEILYKTNFNVFLKKAGVGKVLLLGKPLALIFNKGLYDSEVIEEWIQKLLIKKGITKFKDVMINGKSRLKIIASDITRSKMLILPDDLKDYGIDPMEFSIAKAVRMSCAIPLFFSPYELKYGEKVSFIVDGALLSNFPIWIFDIDGIPRWPTFGMKIKDLDSNTSKGKTNIISYVKDIIDAPINQDETNFVRRKEFVRTIIIDYDGKVSATNFNKADTFIKSFLDNGYNSAIKFINSWDFRKYVQLYRS